MAQKFAFIISCKKITNPQGSVLFDGGTTSSGTTKDITLVLQGTSVVAMAIAVRSGSTSASDVLLQTSDGWKFEAIQEYADFNTSVSATDISSS